MACSQSSNYFFEQKWMRRKLLLKPEVPFFPTQVLCFSPSLSLFLQVPVHELSLL